MVSERPWNRLECQLAYQAAPSAYYRPTFQDLLGTKLPQLYACTVVCMHAHCFTAIFCYPLSISNMWHNSVHLIIGGGHVIHTMCGCMLHIFHIFHWADSILSFHFGCVEWHILHGITFSMLKKGAVKTNSKCVINYLIVKLLHIVWDLILLNTCTS